MVEVVRIILRRVILVPLFVLGCSVFLPIVFLTSKKNPWAEVKEEARAGFEIFWYGI